MPQKKTAGAARRTPNGIEMTTVVFLPEGEELPSRIKLSECSLPIVPQIKGYVSGLYGYQSKMDGLAAASAYAKKNKLRMLIVDYLVVLDKPLIKGEVSEGVLDKTEFVSMQRIYTSLRDEIAEYWKEWLHKEGQPRVETAYKWNYTESFVGRRPDLVAKLFSRKEWRGVKLIAHPAGVSFSKTPLVVGTHKPGTVRIDNIRLRQQLSASVEIVA